MTYTVHDYIPAYTVSLSMQVTIINKKCSMVTSIVSINIPLDENL